MARRLGPIVDRSREHLGSPRSSAIIVARQPLLEATHALERGEPLRGTDPASYRDVRAVDLYIPMGAPWQDALNNRRVEIPKSDGRTRPLGIPTVADRIAQMVVTRLLQPVIDPQFHEDSYGYRPKKSAEDALAVARQRCWRYNSVLDRDIKAFFETLDLDS